MVCVMRFGWLCRICASLKDKDRLLLRPGEGRAWTEEEEKESKPHTTLLPAPYLYYCIYILSLIGRSLLPLVSGQCATDVRSTDLPDHTTAGREYFISHCESCSYQSMFAGSVVDV